MDLAISARISKPWLHGFKGKITEMRLFCEHAIPELGKMHGFNILELLVATVLNQWRWWFDIPSKLKL